MLYMQESLGNVNIERAEYVQLMDSRVVPFQRASDIIEVEDLESARAWVSRNGLTLITTSAAQAIYDAHVVNGDEEARTLS